MSGDKNSMKRNTPDGNSSWNDAKLIGAVVSKLSKEALSFEQTAVLLGLLGMTDDKFDDTRCGRLEKLAQIISKISVQAPVDRRILCLIVSVVLSASDCYEDCLVLEEQPNHSERKGVIWIWGKDGDANAKRAKI